MVVEVGEHAGQAGDDLQALAVTERGRGQGRVGGQDFAAGQLLEQAEDLVDPFVFVQPGVPRRFAQFDAAEEAERPVAADVEFVVLLDLGLPGQCIFRQPQQGCQEFGQFIADEQAESPYERAVEILTKEALREALENLSYRERRVLELRYGLGGEHPRTLDEVGRTFNVTRERIRQIEAKALRKLRHPSRSEKLRSFLEGES